MIHNFIKSAAGQITLLTRAVRLVWRAGPFWMAAGMGLVIVQGLLPLLSLYLMKLIIDAVAAAVSGSPALPRLFLWIGMAGGAAAVTMLCGQAAGLVQEIQNQAVADHVYHVIHEKSAAVDLAYYENAEYFDTLHRAQVEGSFRPVEIIGNMFQVLQGGVSLAAVGGLLFMFHWSIPLILLACGLPGLGVRLSYSRRLFRWQESQTEKERRAHYFDWILTGDAFAKELRLFDFGAFFVNRFKALRESIRTGRTRILKSRLKADLAAQFGATAAVFGFLAFVAVRTAAGRITLGSMVMYFQAFQRGLDFLQSLLRGLAGLHENNLFLTNFYRFLDIEPRVVAPQNPVTVPRPLREGIVFDGVTFAYPGTDMPVLTDISLTIPPGSVAALVGENGSGKTTLAKLLCRFYDPDCGVIRWDGTDIRNFDPVALRKEISVVFQDYAKYQLTARENIRLGNTAVPADPRALAEAVRKAGAERLVASWPDGIDTPLGRWFEDGRELSVGEWQKIAMARSFFRGGQVIVLDEPTSSLDAGAEYELFSGFREMIAGRTAVIISHRFSTVRMADLILVLHEGRIIERGCHDALMEAGGVYARLFNHQAGMYHRARAN